MKGGESGGLESAAVYGIGSSAKSQLDRPVTPVVREWNTTNLGLRLASDAAAAASAGALVAPAISMVDR